MNTLRSREKKKNKKRIDKNSMIKIYINIQEDLKKKNSPFRKGGTKDLVKAGSVRVIE